MRNDMAKGGQFERDMCKAFSLWWTEGKHEDWFWRTAGSGARATVRAKQGKRTSGHGSDMCSTHPKANVLTRLITFEFKKGYNRCTLGDLLDRPRRLKPQEIEKW